MSFLVRVRLGSAVAVLAVSAAISNPVSGQTPLPVISVAPSGPTSLTPLQITVNTNTFCYVTGVNDGISTAVLGATIRISARLTCTVVGVPNPPFVFTQTVGPLPAGTYVVEYWAQHSSGSISGTSQLRATSTVSVTAGYDAIPTMSVAGLTVLTAAMAWVTALMLRRRLR